MCLFEVLNLAKSNFAEIRINIQIIINNCFRDKFTQNSRVNFNEQLEQFI